MKGFLVWFACFAAALSMFFAAVVDAAPKIPKGGEQILPFTRYGSQASATTGSAALVFVVPGLKAGDSCVVTALAFGTGPVAVRGPAVATADTLTVTMDASQSGGSTTIAYACFKS